MIADLGQTPNSTATIQHLVANDPGVSYLDGSLLPASVCIRLCACTEM